MVFIVFLIGLCASLFHRSISVPFEADEVRQPLLYGDQVTIFRFSADLSMTGAYFILDCTVHRLLSLLLRCCWLEVWRQTRDRATTAAPHSFHRFDAKMRVYWSWGTQLTDLRLLTTTCHHTGASEKLSFSITCGYLLATVMFFTVRTPLLCRTHVLIFVIVMLSFLFLFSSVSELLANVGLHLVQFIHCECTSQIVYNVLTLPHIIGCSPVMLLMQWRIHGKGAMGAIAPPQRSEKNYKFDHCCKFLCKFCWGSRDFRPDL